MTLSDAAEVYPKHPQRLSIPSTTHKDFIHHRELVYEVLVVARFAALVYESHCFPVVVTLSCVKSAKCVSNRASMMRLHHLLEVLWLSLTVTALYCESYPPCLRITCCMLGYKVASSVFLLFLPPQSLHRLRFKATSNNSIVPGTAV